MSTHSIKYQHRKHNTYLFRVNLLKTSAFDKEKKPSAHFQLFLFVLTSFLLCGPEMLVGMMYYVKEGPT